MRLLKIRATFSGIHHYGSNEQKALAILHCSSLGYSGVHWGKVSERIGGKIESWGTPGSSPAEWEAQHQRRSPSVNQAFIVLSPYDLNEYNLCDFRANIVPLTQAIADLRQVRADWPFSKMVLSQYPVTYVRKLFPTVGRSDGVMTGIRDWLRVMIQGRSNEDASDGVKFGAAGFEEVKQRLTDWTPARLQRRLVQMHGAWDGRHFFNGPKKMALQRLAQQTGNNGQLTFIVVPVSPIYQKEFLDAKVREEFESSLNDLQRLCPMARMVRLDHLPNLQDDALFSDLVHMNMHGQKIATDVFLSQFETTATHP